MPRQVVRRVDTTDSSRNSETTNSRKSTVRKVVLDVVTENQSSKANSLSTEVSLEPISSVAGFAGDQNKLNNYESPIESATYRLHHDNTDTSDHGSSKENEDIPFKQSSSPPKSRHSLSKGVLVDITENPSVNQSLAIEAAIKGMDRVSLDGGLPNAHENSFEAAAAASPSPIYTDDVLRNAVSEPNAPKERLTILKLVLTNFKSYAGSQEIGPFHPSFSAVVGPNGSGKSNVIDSLLFVFGFRASKMRQSKVSALIHSSAAHPDLSSCTVDVYFQDVVDQPDDTITVVPDSELIVSRRAFRNNSSKYYINGKESSFQEVTGLLKGRGIDLDHKRFLILQGEVESIAQMKPKAENDNDDGLLEYLEDIIGTSDYKPVIEEAESKVEALNEDCSEKQSRLKIVENELNSLEGQRSEILKFLETENEISQAKHSLLELNIFNCNQKIELSQKCLDEESEKLEQEIAKVSGNTDEIEALKKECLAKSRELEKLKSGMQSLSKLLSKQEIEKVQLEEKKKHVEVKRKKLDKQLDAAEFKQREVDAWLSNSEEETGTLNAQITQLEESLEKEQAVYQSIQDDLKDKTKVFADEMEETQQKLGPWRERITGKESELAVATSEADLIKEKNNSANQLLQEAKEKVRKIMEDGKEREQKLTQLKKEQHYVSEQVVLGTRECGEASLKLEKMKEKLDSMRQSVNSAKEALASSSSQNTVLASLTKLSQSGRVQGFHGRLGGLGTIDQQFDVAISTACPSLDNFVVDSVEAGQQCVEYLRKNNLGRGKFILLAQLQKKNMAPIQTPENVPRLFDLVKFQNEKFAPAFYSVLGDTLVAKDVEQARRIAYGKRRFRIVTIDGVVVDTSGTMSGGGQALRGGMQSEATSGVNEKELVKMEKEKDIYEQSYKEAESTLYLMQSSLKELEERKPRIEMEISKTKMDIENLSASWKESQIQYKEIQKEVKSSRPDTGALEALDNKVAKITADLEELKEHSKGLEDKIAELQEKILDAGGVELRMQRAKVDGIREQLDLINTRLSNGVMERKKMQNESKKQAATIATSRKEIASGELELEDINGKLDEKSEAVESLSAELNKANDAHDDKLEQLEELKKTLSSKQAEIDDLRSTEIDLRNSIEELEKNISEASTAIELYSRQQLELKLHDIALISGRSKSDTAKAAVNAEVEADDDSEAGSSGSKEVDMDSADTTTANNTTTTEASADTSRGAKAQFVEHSEDEIRDLDAESLSKAIAKLEAQIKDTRVDMQVLKEYQRRLSEYEKRRDDLNASVSSRDDLRKKCDSYRQKRLTEFMAGFNTISAKLKEMYQMITMGGNAELELVDSLDPFSEGILFSVMPPKKSWRNISNLSGGEKTLSSLALVFALHHFKPTPLYVMDEIDAALDFRNVSIVATYIKERTKHGQFVVISLRNNMFELAQQLVGIYKVNNMTKSIALQNKDYITR